MPFLLRVFPLISPFAGLSTLRGTVCMIFVDVDDGFVVDFFVGLVDLRFLPGDGSASTVTRILHGDSPPFPPGVSRMTDFEGLFGRVAKDLRVLM